MQTKEVYVERARKMNSKMLAIAMRDKYLAELYELRERTKLEARDLSRVRELRKVLVALNGIK